MNAVKYRLIALFLSLICILPLPAQKTAAPTVTDPVTTLDLHAARLRNFARYNPQEKVWLHFDNAGYFSGDTIWFKAYIHSAMPSDTVLRSRTLYVDLVSPAGRVLLTRKLKIEHGQCYGDIPLVQSTTGADSTGAGRPSLNAGFYEVRAYTRAMLNQGTEALFSRVFPVYDRPAFAGDYALRMTPAKEAFPSRRPETDSDRDLNVEFYPEGGTSIAGLPSRVAFRITDKSGNPVDTEATFRAPDGSETTVRTLHDGMGLLLYTPTSSVSGTLTIATDKGRNREFTLPKAAASGYTLYIDNRRPDAFNLIVRASADLPAEVLGVAIQHEGNLCYYDTLNISGGATTARRFNSTTLPTGVCQLTLFGASGIVADRLFFITNGTGPATDDLQLALTPTGQMQPDALCGLHVSTKRADGSACPTTLSVAIRDAEETDARPTAEDPRIELLLASEVKGYIHRPDYYFSGNDAAHRQALDLLLMVQGWRRYDWMQMAGLSNRPLSYYREEGLILNGYVFNRRGRKPIADKDVHITMRNADRTLTLRGDCRTDSLGNFNFLFDDFYDRWELTISLGEDKGRQREMQYRIDRVLTPKLRPYAFEEITMPNSGRSDTSRYRSLDREQQLATIEVNASRRKKEGIHLELDVDREANRLVDLGRYCPDVETFLDEMDLGFAVESIIDTSELSNPDSSATALGKDRQPYLWGEKANVLCMQIGQTSFRNARHMTQGPFWATLLPIGEVKSIQLYDIAYLRSHSDILDQVYVDSIVSRMLETSLGGIIEKSEIIEEKQDQKKGYVRALVLVEPKPLLEHRSAPKSYRVTYFDGYYTPQTFTADYSQRRPEGEDVRRTLYWNPDLHTDASGQADITFRLNSSEHSVAFSVVATPADGSTLPQARNITVRQEGK